MRFLCVDWYGGATDSPLRMALSVALKDVSPVLLNCQRMKSKRTFVR